MTLLSKFFEGREALFETFEEFDDRHGLGIINSLYKENNEVDFLSKITEIHFGLFFGTFSSSVKYSKMYDKLTPDWALTINGQEIIAEVMRLNPSVADKVKLDFDSKFMNALHEIKQKCVLEFSYDDKIINIDKINIIKCKALVESWLNNKPAINEMILIDNMIEVRLINYIPNVEHVCLIGGGGAINFNYNRLRGENSALLKKARKYSQIVDKYNLPYIICIYLDFHSWFDKDDLYRTLYGLSVEHEAEINYFSHDIENALFYSEREIMANVSGVLLRQNGEFTYYNNYHKNNRLKDINQELFSEWQYTYESYAKKY